MPGTKDPETWLLTFFPQLSVNADLKLFILSFLSNFIEENSSVPLNKVDISSLEDFMSPLLDSETIKYEHQNFIDLALSVLPSIHGSDSEGRSPYENIDQIQTTMPQKSPKLWKVKKPSTTITISPATSPLQNFANPDIPLETSRSNPESLKQKKTKIPKSQKTTVLSTPNLISEPEIVVTSQVSRYHAETFDADTLELDLPGVNITVNGKELLEGARLRLKTGSRYGLIGKNGIGKSILLRAIGEKSMIGFPKNLKTLYVEQESFNGGETTVLQSIIDSDLERLRIIRESEALETAITQSNLEISKLYRKLLLRRAEEERHLAWEIAEKRSGARGWDARKVLLEKETNLVKAREYIKAESFEAKAREILTGLGFSKQQQISPTSTLSGGWKMRLSLARALFLKPDLMCLDEPTNHLDLPSVIWFQEYLKNECEGQT
ncbi:hypothetical protein HK096_005343, partial [Nowakowskiella sp. JEL0078]